MSHARNAFFERYWQLKQQKHQRPPLFEGEIVFDASKPDGTPQKLLDVSRLAKLGWHAATGIEQGVEKTYEHYLECLKPAKQ